MELLNFIAERGAMNVFLTWVTVCSVKCTSSPYRNNYDMFTADTTNIKLDFFSEERRGAYSKSHTVHDLLRVTLQDHPAGGSKHTDQQLVIQEKIKHQHSLWQETTEHPKFQDAPFLLTLHLQFHPQPGRAPPYSPTEPSSQHFFYRATKMYMSTF